MNLFVCLLALFTASFAQKQYHYETVPNDPLKARVYTLDNGLKVYMSVNKEVPRIDCSIGIRVGDKHASNGFPMAQMMMHLIHAGSENMGTLNWEKEQLLLDEIETLTKLYHNSKDSADKAHVFAQIDTLSYLASQYVSYNEYSRILDFIKAVNPEVYASEDFTKYNENIPKNQIENWAHFHAEALARPAFRNFYAILNFFSSERNANIPEVKDQKMALSSLYPNHPYSWQTVENRQKFLNNPSVAEAKAFYERYYIPNNTAIALSGDLDFEETIAIIDQYFGKWMAKTPPQFHVKEEQHFEKPLVKELLGRPDVVLVAYRINLHARTDERRLFDVFLELLDEKIEQARYNERYLKKKNECAIIFANDRNSVDNATLCLYGMKNDDETLETTYRQLLAEIESLKNGDFPEEWLQQVIRQKREKYEYTLSMNSERTYWMMQSFQNGTSWSQASQDFEFYKTITKQDVMQFASRYLKENHAVFFGKEGIPPQVRNLPVPDMIPITKIDTLESRFFNDLKAREVRPLEPQFVDFDQAIHQDKIKKTDLYYIKNEINSEFEIQFRFPVGVLNDLRWELVDDYAGYTGTSEMDVFERIQKTKELSCRQNTKVSDDETVLTITGLDETFEEALALSVACVADAVADEAAFKEVIAEMIAGRAEVKKMEQAHLVFLKNYVEYGKEQVDYQLLDDDLQQLKSSELIALIRSLVLYQPEIYYYGPASLNEVKSAIQAHYPLLKKGKKNETTKVFERIEPAENQVYFLNTEAEHTRVGIYSYGNVFDISVIPYATMYNRYIGEMIFKMKYESNDNLWYLRINFMAPEQQGAQMAQFLLASIRGKDPLAYLTNCNEIVNEIPLNDTVFKEMKEKVLSSIDDLLISKTRIFSEYRRAKKMGIDYNLLPEVYAQIKEITLEDLVRFHEQHIKNQKRTYMIIGNKENIDFERLEAQYGKAIEVTTEQIFGYP